MSVISNRDIYDAINELRKEVAEGYVRKEEFRPVKSIAYGAVGLILIAFITALIVLVIPEKKSTQQLHIKLAKYIWNRQ